MSLGLSFIVCTHNGVQRLPQTLSHLARVRNEGNVPWEVIVIDNASTDDTADAAHRHWPAAAPAPLRVIREPRLGKSYALYHGFSVASHEILTIVDDDNWLEPNWLGVMLEIMTAHPDVAACGGDSYAVTDGKLPAWFERYQAYYAVGKQGDEPGDIANGRGWLWGAGMGVRKAAWEELVRNGFQWKLVCRQGSSLSSWGDAELCFALRLAGWRLWYDPRLRFGHYVPRHRLSWRYLRHMFRACGQSGVGLDPYDFALNGDGSPAAKALKQTWPWQAYSTSRGLFAHFVTMMTSVPRGQEGDPNLLELERALGRLVGLWRARKHYKQDVAQILRAPWMKKR